ncbi:PIN domain-containing protein [Subtercola lobariae]|uniref:Ribonuclease VapC n=1 Tax=Subtercola lobariae TaxID=1588641 RepID=A0A917B4B4_9MICO|nr:PIN domain-containing protein [Subtercola lobariae]GGF19487.1 ribonuclease VapC [Subtercola lobariae]
MSECILDTNVLIAEAGVNLPDDTTFLVTSISYAELQFGLSTSLDNGRVHAERSLRVNRAKAIYGPGLPFDDQASTSYGYLTELLLMRGRSPRGRIVDIMIASIAHSRGASLITRNVDDFIGLEDALDVMPS